MEIHIRRKHPGKVNVFAFMKNPFYYSTHSNKNNTNSLTPYELRPDLEVNQYTPYPPNQPNNQYPLYQSEKIFTILKQIQELDDNNFSQFVIYFTKYFIKRNKINSWRSFKS